MYIFIFHNFQSILFPKKKVTCKSLNYQKSANVKYSKTIQVGESLVYIWAGAPSCSTGMQPHKRTTF